MRFTPPLWVLTAGTLAFLLAPGTVLAQAADEACEAPEYRQFDFWIGMWEVRRPNGEVAGTNSISSVLEGCAIAERWVGASGGKGRSTTAYDERTKTWNQMWVDEDGLVLRLEGSIRDGAMVLRGRLVQEDGATVLQRITWTPADDGSVRQLWEASEDEGENWSIVFDGVYSEME